MLVLGALRYFRRPPTKGQRSSTFLWQAQNETRRVDIARYGGNLDHYYHFIMDLVWPLHEWVKREGLVASEAVLLAAKPRDLYFAAALYELLGVRMAAMPNASPAETGAPVRLAGFNTKSGDHWKTFHDVEAFRKAREAFVSTVADRMGREALAPPAVVLIKRKDDNGDRGATRRCIERHEDVAAALSTWCAGHGLAFHDLHLEDLDIRQQFALFHRGPVVLIGQHGAGLVNGIWMVDARSAVVELAGPDNPPHFTNLFNDLGMRYVRLLCDGPGHHMAGQRITVDQEALIAALEQVVA